MFDLGTIYRPLTASPFRHNESYCEIMPCEALRPYIRCFWGTPAPVEPAQLLSRKEQNSLVVPDTCMDIIFNINYDENRLDSAFCALDERAHQAGMQNFSGKSATFAVRFYVWAVHLFADESLQGTKNCSFEAERFFGRIKAELEPLLFYVPTLRERAVLAENILLRHMKTERMNNCLMNALYYMISTSGREKISSAAQYAGVSEKQLERVFSSNTGVSPKCLSSLVRYQLLWQELVCGGNSDILDAVEKYGYCDQAHLLNDFRRHHLLTPSAAVEFAGRR